MSEETKYLKLARAAREENNSEDAKKFYDMVRIDDPENGEAKFFYMYYSLYEGKNGEIASRFIKLVNVLDTSVKFIAQSSDTEDEKLKIVKAIVDAYTPMTWSLNRYMNNLKVGSGSNAQRVLPASDIQSACVAGVIGLYDLGDIIENCFPNNSQAMQLAVVVWKEAISLHQKWYAYKYNGKTPDSYAAKIQKFDSSYVIPKKAGCVSFADKR